MPAAWPTSCPASAARAGTSSWSNTWAATSTPRMVPASPAVSGSRASTRFVVSLDLLQLALCQAGSHRANGVRLAVLVRHDGVHVALDHDHQVSVADSVLGPIQSVQRGALVEQLSLWRVDELCRLLVSAEVTSAESDDVAARISNGK